MDRPRRQRKACYAEGYSLSSRRTMLRVFEIQEIGCRRRTSARSINSRANRRRSQSTPPRLRALPMPRAAWNSCTAPTGSTWQPRAPSACRSSSPPPRYSGPNPAHRDRCSSRTPFAGIWNWQSRSEVVALARSSTSAVPFISRGMVRRARPVPQHRRGLWLERASSGHVAE